VWHPHRTATNDGQGPSNQDNDDQEPRAASEEGRDDDGEPPAATFLIQRLLQLAKAAVVLPQTYKQAMNSPDAKQWETAMQSEFDSLQDRKVWTLVKLPAGRTAVKCRWVFDIKSDGRYKARLVAKGFSQQPGIDFNETFSPVARYESIRTVLALASLEDWELETMDVKIAYLYGILDEEIYMEQPEGSVQPSSERKVCRLLRAIYGLKQSGRKWNEEIHCTLMSLGFIRTQCDAGVYVYCHREGNTEIILILYVDNLLLAGPKMEPIITLKKDLAKSYQMVNNEPAKSFLGLNIRRDRTKRTLTVDQRPYLEQVLARFGMTDCKPACTPLPSGVKLEASTEEADTSMRLLYQSIIGSILWASIGTRPDVSYHVVRLSAYCANPSQAHLNHAKWILRYLSGTLSRAIEYKGSSQSGLIAYTDADWAKNRDDWHSVTGNAMLLAEAPISWLSRRQKTVTLLSTESKYMAMSDCCRQVAFSRMFLEELGENLTSPIPICADNQGSIFLAVNPVHDRRTKHIDIHYHCIQEFVEAKHGEIFYVSTDDQLADLFTKPLAHVRHTDLAHRLGLIDH
jgi:hypothetical protein